MTNLEKRMYDANKKSLETLKVLRNSELENTTLKNYIIELKS